MSSNSEGDRPQRFTEAVGALHRLPCNAQGWRPASRNSLRSLRSLRSDSRDESDDDARCARGHQPWALPASQRRAVAGLLRRVAGLGF